MTEVYRALQMLGCSWVVRARYQVSIRWPAGPGEINDGDGGSGSHVLASSPVASPPLARLTLQLFKVHSNISLLDFQRVEGDCFSCMSLCSRIITALKTMSASSRSRARAQAQARAQQAQAQALALAQANGQPQTEAEVMAFAQAQRRRYLYL